MVTKNESVRTELIPANGDRAIAKIDRVEILDISAALHNSIEAAKQATQLVLQEQVEALKSVKGEAEGILDSEFQVVIERERLVISAKTHSEIRRDSR